MERTCQNYLEMNTNEIFDIDIPVIYIAGIVCCINEYEQFQKLQISFHKLGYKVGVISNSKEVQRCKDCYYCDIREYSVEEVFRINHLVKRIENENDYDLLIVGLVSGVGIVGRKLVGDFGLEIYCWRRAVPIDCIVLNILYGNYTTEVLELLGKSVQDVLGIDVDFYNIVNQMLDFDESEKNNAIRTWLVAEDAFEHSFLEIKSEKVFALLYEDEIERLRNQIITRLNKYSQIERV